LRRYYPADSDELLLEKIRTRAFITDPAQADELFNTRHVQVAQDALVVEAIPGHVPLLEGFQMAHRMLDVQKACLENAHLAERIRDRPWQQSGADAYRVDRHEGVTSVTEHHVDVPLPPAAE
jgi:hypothetical protein